MRKLSRSVTVALIAAPLAVAGAGVATAAPIIPILSELTSSSEATSSIDQSVTQDQSNETTQSNDSELAPSIAEADGLIPVDVDLLSSVLGGDSTASAGSDQGNANETEQGQEAGQLAAGGDQG